MQLKKRIFFRPSRLSHQSVGPPPGRARAKEVKIKKKRKQENIKSRNFTILERRKSLGDCDEF
jgi:hypothetical protein